MKKYKFDYSPKTRPFPHQTEALEFIRAKELVPLFDEQGLGKTKIVIDALMEDMKSGIIEGALIICRKFLLSTWEDEIKKHSHLRSIILRGSAIERGSRFMAFSHFYLINYDSLISEIDRIKRFLSIRKLAIVLDESQRIKNPSSKTAQCIFQIRLLATKKIIITGTPIANKPEDIWAQFYFLDSGRLLGIDFTQFKKEYSIDLRGKALLASKVKKLDKLKDVISQISIRRLKDQVLELPEKRFIDVFVSLRALQLRLYNKLKKELYLEIIDFDGQRIIDESQNILKKLLRLTQIASNPALLNTEYNETPAKFLVLDKLIKGIIEKEEKVIIWSNFVKNIRTLRRRYREFNPLMLFGEIPIENRKFIVKKFQENTIYNVLIANPSAAREGLTLTSANNAIYLDRNFNLTDYLQSQDRIHRISQTKPCNITKIIAEDTIDEYIDEILYKKHKIAQYLQSDIKEIKEEKDYLTKEELVKILG